jgi:putative transposase
VLPARQAGDDSGVVSPVDHLVLFGERHLRYVVKEFIAHYHRERFHRGLGGQLIEKRASSATDKRTSGKVMCRSRLGGILNFYYREAA